MIKKKTIITIFILTILIITLGISFAYFTAELTGKEDSDTIMVTGGKMNIVYEGGPEINAPSVGPGDNPIAVKTFTVTGNNTTPINMGYKLNLVITHNDFTELALTYKLISTNTDNNGIVAPSVDMTNLGTGAKTIELGIGFFDVPTGGNKTHTYRLEIFFLNQNYNQNEDQRKTFGAYVQIENYSLPLGTLLSEAILNQEGGVEAVLNKEAANFNFINGTSGLYAAEDEYGTSYYYRGKKTELNNNLIWGGFQWKIIRINGDGSIRLLYNGTELEFNTNGVVNNTGVNTEIGNYYWNGYHNDAKYLGYMFGGANGVTSTSRANAVLNETSSNIKTILESWYQSNIVGKSFESQVANNLYCNDRRLADEIGGSNFGPGYGKTNNNYAARHRLTISVVKSPTLKCAQKNDRFTSSSDTMIGNGVLTYPIGLLTADEAAMAGLVNTTNNLENYLYTNSNWWLFTPINTDGSGNANMFYVYSNGYFGNNFVSTSYGVRPVISIKSEVRVTGTGSASEPFVVGK